MRRAGKYAPFQSGVDPAASGHDVSGRLAAVLAFLTRVSRHKIRAPALSEHYATAPNPEQVSDNDFLPEGLRQPAQTSLNTLPLRANQPYGLKDAALKPVVLAASQQVSLALGTPMPNWGSFCGFVCTQCTNGKLGILPFVVEHLHIVWVDRRWFCASDAHLQTPNT